MKGLHPLIAAILLIGFTIAVGSIIGAFVNNYVKNQTNSIVEPCTGVLYDLNAEINKTSGDVKVIYQYIMGKSDKEIDNLTVTVVCDNVVQEKLANKTLPGFVGTKVIKGLESCDAKENFEAYLYGICNSNIQKLTECKAGDSCVRNVQ